jgi:hypothetical protein
MSRAPSKNFGAYKDTPAQSVMDITKGGFDKNIRPNFLLCSLSVPNFPGFAASEAQTTQCRLEAETV